MRVRSSKVVIAYLSFLCVFLFLSLCNSAEWHTTPLSYNNESDGSQYDATDRYIVWTYKVDGNSEIFLSDGVSTTRLTDNEYNDLWPSISGQKVLWVGFDGNDTEVFLYDISSSTTTQLTNNSLSETEPHVYGEGYIWLTYDGNDREVIHYKNSTAVPLTSDDINYQGVRVDEPYAAWIGSDGSDYEIFLYDGESVDQITHNGYDDLAMEMSGTNIVWQRVGDGDDEIYLYNILTNTITPITNNDAHDAGVSIDGSTIVWSQVDIDGDTEIMVSDTSGTTPYPLTNNNVPDGGPNISGPRIVWERIVDEESEIMVHNGLFETQITNNSNTIRDNNPIISGANIVWYQFDEDESKTQVNLARYLYTENDLNAEISNKWDANADGKIGLEESIQALQIVSGSIVSPGSFQWKADEWGECSDVCGGGSQSRIVECLDKTSSQVVADIFCDSLPKPLTTQTCNLQECTYIWVTGTWSNCSVVCGDGVMTRTVDCKNDVSGEIVSDSFCEEVVKPIDQVTCNQGPC